MSVRTTIDIPDELYQALRLKAAAGQTSIRSLVVIALENQFKPGRRRKRLSGPPVPGSGKPGKLCPDRENPYDLVFP